MDAKMTLKLPPGTLYTSLAEIQSFDPCREGWEQILKGQNKVFADAVLFPLVECLKSNSVDDVIWLLGRRKHEIDICVKFAQDCACSVSVEHADKYAAMYARQMANDIIACVRDSERNDSNVVAGYALRASDHAIKAAYSRIHQQEKHKQFLRNRIHEYETRAPFSGETHANV